MFTYLRRSFYIAVPYIYIYRPFIMYSRVFRHCSVVAVRCGLHTTTGGNSVNPKYVRSLTRSCLVCEPCVCVCVCVFVLQSWGVREDKKKL